MIQAIKFEDGDLLLLDQTALPLKTEWLRCTTWQQVAEAIRRLVVRGAPAIGVAAAYGMALAAKHGRSEVEEANRGLAASRPTAVNLFWALKRVMDRAQLVSGDGDELYGAILALAHGMAEEDREMCRAIGEAGVPLIPRGATIMTVCNTGALATAGWGTALGVIRAAHLANRGINVIACETRPLLQGARLTAWELLQDGIPATLITDSMAAHVMKTKKVNLVIAGADRIAANGDTANKIGTYGLAVLARHHGIPFYIAAPASTVDLDTPCGDIIVIEERNEREVTHLAGARTAPEGIRVFNPAFDVTPHSLISAIVTDQGIVYPPYSGALRAIARRAPEL